MLWLRRSLLVAALAFGFMSSTALPAAAKSYSLPSADIAYEVVRDGSVIVTESLTYKFDGSFRGGFRLIPISASRGESISDISVSENGGHYEPGGSSTVGIDSAPGTFGVAQDGDWTRVVWHFAASNEERTFTIRYRVSGFVTAYDDVGDLYVQVWGNQWRVPVSSLRATVRLPSFLSSGVKPVRVWGHPRSVAGQVSVRDQTAWLTATDVPAGQFVELRVVFPRSLLNSSGEAVVRSGSGLPQILAEEEQDFTSSRFGNAPEQGSQASGGTGWGFLKLLLLLLLAPFLLVARLLGFGSRGGSDSGSGGSLGGSGGGGRGGGGGGAW